MTSNPTTSSTRSLDEVAAQRGLRRRAAEAHQSLQEYLRSRLIADAGQPTLDEVLDRIGHRSGGRAHLEDTTRIVRNDRDRR